MKKAFCLFASALLSIPALGLPPQIAAEQALKIASEYLRDHGYSKDHFVSGLTL